MREKRIYQIYFGLLFVWLLVLQQTPANGQQLSKSFTINDGLPSNLVYSMVQDDKGFLWIGTDNGVARFDGKYFRTFTTADGLPDNEILEVRKENDGTIWVNTFKQGPFYFDEKTNRFIDPLAGVNINRDFIKMVLHVRTLAEGGIVFYNLDNELVFKNKKFVQLPYKVAFSFSDGKSRAYLYSELKGTTRLNNYIYYRDDKKLDSLLLYTTDPGDKTCVKFLMEDKLYLMTKKGFFYVIGYDKALSKFNVQTIKINRELIWFRLTGKRINISSADGKIYVYDRKGLFEHYSIEEKDLLNSILEDNEKNIWVGTLNRGLRLYKNNQIQLLPIIDGVDKSFLCVSAASNGKVYAGNYYGEIVEINNDKQQVSRPFGKGKQIWIRSMISVGNKIFTVAEQGVLADFKRRVYSGNEILQRMKDIKAFNDSFFVAAGMDPRGALYKVNIKTEKATRLNSGLIRISRVEGYKGRYVYCATNEGLFKYDYQVDKVVNDFKNTPLAGERIMEIETTPQGLLIVATSMKGIYILKDDKVISRLDNERIITDAVTDIVVTPKNSFWISTRNGLSKVDYTFQGDNFRYSSNNFSMTEGLPANVITDINYRNDTIFLATENGVAFLPANLNLPGQTIKTVLTGLRANHENISLSADNKYVLTPEQRSVYLEFSGINLSGHLKRIQYSFDPKKEWINLDAGDLSLELSPGQHTLFVRSMDINGGKNNPVMSIYFDVRAPFYQRIWFIIGMAGLIAGLLVFIVYRVRTAKQKRELQNQLRIEQERNRITADLHDDIGSTLSSLQIYSDVAYSIIDKDQAKAKTMLQQISTGASKISENIGDIIWSMKGNQAYALSLDSRIKNIVSEALGITDIDYEMHIDETADRKITCITCRKNMILIVKEAINNVVKYSNASKVVVELKQVDKHFILRIRDNGVGMNVIERKFAGNGLSNMQKRMAEIDGKCDIISSIGNGTEIICQFHVTKN